MALNGLRISPIFPGEVTGDAGLTKLYGQECTRFTFLFSFLFFFFIKLVAQNHLKDLAAAISRR